MENVVCPICEVDNSDFYYDKERNNDPVNFVKCRQCGLVYQNPRKTYEEFKVYYEDDFRKTNNIEKDIEKYIDSRIYVGKEILSLIEQYFYKNLRNRLYRKFFGRKKIRVLDIGCGVGGVLFPFKEAGYTCKGIDVPSDYTKIGKEKIGIDIEEVFITDFKSEIKFDIIILCHSLEHFLEPVEYLGKINSLLKPGGIVYIEIPDIERPYNWAPLKFFFMLGHVFYYSPSTLNLLMNKCGFYNKFFDSENTPFLRSVYIKNKKLT